MEKPSPTHCRRIAPHLTARDGQKTRVELSGPRSLEVFNIAWGDDMGDDYEHITSNISPMVDGSTIELFFTDEVVRIVDPLIDAVLWETDGTPNNR